MVRTLAAQPATTDTIYYVSKNGSDSNDGLSWGSAKLTFQAAYDALPSAATSAGGGGICAAPGRYDVGTGLVLDRRKCAKFEGAVRPKRFVTGTSGTIYNGQGAVVLFSSTGAESLVNTDTPAATVVNGYGFEFRNLVFEMKDATTLYGIRAPSLSMCVVDNCQFWMGLATSITDQVAGIYAYTDSTRGDDASWWRITNNLVSRGALCILGNDTGTNFNSNQHIVQGNVCFGQGVDVTTARAGIRLVGNTRSVIRDNNVEHYDVGIALEDTILTQESGDGGEQVRTFIDLVNARDCRLAPTGPTNIVTPSGTVKLVRADATSLRNIIDVYSNAYGTGLTSDALSLSGNAARDNVVNGIERRWTYGIGTPEAAVLGNPGDLYTNKSGGASTTLYVKESGTGNTGWVAK